MRLPFLFSDQGKILSKKKRLQIVSPENLRVILSRVYEWTFVLKDGVSEQGILFISDSKRFYSSISAMSSLY